jgi:NAD(P)-dependent dehydrogenase (short-subunit alcohol dehydrogenase family)
MASVLITGASKGIGRGLAREFAGRGYRVVATARDPRTLRDLDADQRLALDVTDPNSVAAAVAQAGEIDVLVSNAGVIFYSAVEAIPLPAFRDLLEINTLGALAVAQAVLPQMRERGRGRLLFMSSVAGRAVRPAGGAYAATKWALEGLVEGLAPEVAPFGVQVSLLEPGAVSSGALDDVTRHTLAVAPDPYAPVVDVVRDPASFITVEQVATEVADAAQADPLPLRIPIGDPARAFLGAAA